MPEEKDLAHVEERLRAINTFAPIIRTQRSQVSVDQVLNINAFDLDKTLERDSEFLDTDAEHVHDETISSLGIRVAESVDLDVFQVSNSNRQSVTGSRWIPSFSDNLSCCRGACHHSLLSHASSLSIFFLLLLLLLLISSFLPSLTDSRSRWTL